MNRRVVEAMLTRLGHSVALARDGASTLERLETEVFDLILMDVQMPGMSGIETIRAIRQREALGDSRTPVIALTAQAMRGDREACLEAGMDAYLTKPLDANELDLAISEWIAISRGAPGTNPPYDRNRLQRRIGNDPEVFDDLVELFERDSRSLMKTLGIELERGAGATAARAAHALKGMLLNLCAEDAAAIVKRVEGACSKGDLESAGALLPELRTAIERLRAALVFGCGRTEWQQREASAR
jgi:CheY-like chemotaxis protein